MILTPQVAREALLLVNTPDAYDGLQGVLAHTLEQERDRLERATDMDTVNLTRGRISIIRELMNLRTEVVHRAQEKN